MARTPKPTEYIVTDDLTGKEIEENEAVTVEFSYDGQAYKIETARSNAQELSAYLKPWIDKAEVVKDEKPKTGKSRGKSKGGETEDLAAIRTWALANGHKVADRGRVAKEIKDAYYAAQ